jgi:hypothetical protein
MEWVTSKEFRDKLGMSVREFGMLSWSLLCLGGESGTGPASVVGKSFPIDFVHFMVSQHVEVRDHESILAFIQQSKELVRRIVGEYDQAFSQVIARLSAGANKWVLYEPIAPYINKTAGALFKWDRNLVNKKKRLEVNLPRLCNVVYWRLPSEDGLGEQVQLAKLPAIAATLGRLTL